jgi:hypothetical protein
VKANEVIKRLLVFGTVFVAVLAMWCVPALATSQSYTIVLPRFGQDYYTTSKTVQAYKDFG